MRTRLFFLSLAVALISCDTVPDSHPETFKTLEQAAIERKAKLMTEWQELALNIVHSQRPDLSAEKLAPTSVRLGAESIWQTLDLAPLADRINSHPELEQQIIASAVSDAEKKVDADRLIAMGFGRAKNLLMPQLVGAQKAQVTASPAANNFAGVSWIAVVKLNGAMVPVTGDILSAWKVSAEDVDHAALAHLAEEWKDAADPIETESFDPFGRAGKLRAGINPASILLPDFLPTVRKEWKTSDDLAMVLPSPSGVMFVERGNEKLLAILYPAWKRELLKADDPISTLPMRLGDHGFSLLDYTPPAPPTSAPTTKPKPTPYMVD